MKLLAVTMLDNYLVAGEGTRRKICKFILDIIDSDSINFARSLARSLANLVIIKSLMLFFALSLM